MPVWKEGCIFGYSFRDKTCLQRLSAYREILFRVGPSLGVNSLQIRSINTRAIHPINAQPRHSQWTKAELFEKVNKTIELLQSRGSKETLPELEILNVNHCFDVLEACMEVAKKSRDINVSHQAALLLSAMEPPLRSRSGTTEGTVSTNYFALAPTAPFYDVVLHSYAVCDGGVAAARAAQAILQRMIDRCTAAISEELWPTPPEPTVKTFNIVMNVWARSRLKNAGQCAQEIVVLMDKWNGSCRQPKMPSAYKNNYQGSYPNLRTLVTLIDAWSKSRDPHAADHATTILTKAIQEARNNKSFTLEPALFHVVLGAWAQSRRGRIAAERAEEILVIMEECSHFLGHSLKPNTRTYALVMEVWMRCEQVEQRGDAAKRAELLLRTMLDVYRRERASQIKPNKMCFTTCISAWSRAKMQPDSPERAETLLNLLIELYEETGDDDFCPDINIFNAVIAAWTRATNRSDSMERAKGCLWSLRRFGEPNLVSFNTILDGMGKRGMGEAAIQLLTWLEQVGQDVQAMSPDRISYNSAMSAVSRDLTNGVYAWEKTLGVLKRMESAAQSNGATDLAPDPVSYTIAFGSMLGMESVSIHDACQAYEIVQELAENHGQSVWYCKPDVPVFAALIQACGNVQGTVHEMSKALDIVLKAMDACTSAKFGECNHMTYSLCMRVINQLCDDDNQRRSILEELFKICANGGHVSKQVMISMQKWAWRDQFPALQADWSRKVPLKSRPDQA